MSYLPEYTVLNISKPMSAAALAAYHEGSGDYWIEGGTAPSMWGGGLAEEFGLHGEVKKEQFERLLNGRDPWNDAKLKPGKDGNRGGWDFTFSAPKEFSLLYLRLRQTDPKKAEAMLNEFLESTEWSMGEMEKEAAVQMSNPKRWEKTGNWLWARYLHFDSRPDNKTGMPTIQIHAHYVVFNLTKADVGMRALEIGNLKGTFKSYDGSAALHMASWHSDFARRIKEQGYGIKRTKSIGFGIEGIPRELVDKWSPRRATIVQAGKRILETVEEKRAELTKQYDIKNWDEFKVGIKRRLLADLAKITRLHKQKNLSRDELWQYWDSQLTKEDRKILDAARGKIGWETNSYESLKFALDHTLAPESVVPENRVLATALRYGVGSVSVESLKAEYQNLGVLVNKEGKVSTQEVLDQEGRIIDFAREGRGTMRPLARSSSGSIKRISSPEKDTATLSEEQQAAIRHVWTSPDQVILIRGGAGTGKTTMMKTAIARIDKPVAVLAPSAPASRDTLRKEGFKDANTVAAFLTSKEWQQKISNGVIWVDEAALLPIKELDHITRIGKMVGARIILQGDPKQHKSVARHGNMFHVLQEYAGLPMAELKDIKRQKGKYKEAVAAIQDGDMLKGHDILTEMGAVKYGSDIAGIVDDYLRLRREDSSVLVVAPTHVVGDNITSGIRNRLKTEGKLAHEERTFTSLRNQGWSNAQKLDLPVYDGSEVICFRTNSGDFKTGRKYGISDLLACQKRHSVRKRGRKSKRPAFQPDHFNVYSSGQIKLSPGDGIRITAGGKTIEGKQIDNGDQYTVKGFTKEGNIALTNGQTLSKDYGHIAYAYTTTSYGAQGKTVDHILVAMNKETAPALNAEQFYVSASRGRKSARIYTDMEPAELRELIQRQDKRQSATEVFGKNYMKQLALRARQNVVRLLYEQQEFIPPEIPRHKARNMEYER